MGLLTLVDVLAIFLVRLSRYIQHSVAAPLERV